MIKLRPKMSLFNEILNCTCFYAVSSVIQLTGPRTGTRQVPFPPHQSAQTSQGPPLYKESSKSSQVESVCSVTDRNACQAVVWLSWYSECCGGGQLESKHRQGFYTDSKMPGFHHTDGLKGMASARYSYWVQGEHKWEMIIY